MDTDIRDEIDRSFDEGPPIDDLDLILTRGQEVVRRRRVLGAASTALAATVVVGIALMTTGGGAGTAPGPAVSPSTSLAATPVVPDPSRDVVPDSSFVFVVPDRPVRNAPTVTLEPGGIVETRPGVQVLQTIDGVLDPSRPTRSIAIEYVLDGRTFWFAGAIDDTGTRPSTNTRARSGLTFQEWAAAHPLGEARGVQTTIVTVDSGVDPMEAVDLRADGKVYVHPSVEVTRLDRHPWSEPAGSWAVALVFDQNGETYWFAGRQTGTAGTTLSTPAVAGRTFEDWAAEQRAALMRGGGV